MEILWNILFLVIKSDILLRVVNCCSMNFGVVMINILKYFGCFNLFRFLMLSLIGSLCWKCICWCEEKNLIFLNMIFFCGKDLVIYFDWINWGLKVIKC